jgi:[glutamine synthetase] adenylyltransferase / [glutamine synthetase]-adenylyl-L-tyrosine phosphorylase
MRREADWLREALAQPPEAAMAAILDAIDTGPTAEALAAALRTAKRRAALLIALATSGAWDLAAVTGALTDLADRAVQVGAGPRRRRELARGKLPGCGESHVAEAAGMFVLAMGKMGAGELNYSSDIDLIVLFDETRHDPADYAELRRGFIRITQRMVKLLSEVTDRRRLRLPHRPAPAPRPVGHPGLHRHRAGRALLREPRPHLGARRLHQGPALRRARSRRLRPSSSACAPSSGAGTSTTPRSRTPTTCGCASASTRG